MSEDAQRLNQALVELSTVQLELDRERLLRIEVEALFDDVLDAMTDAVVVTDPAGRVRRQNRAALAMLGPNPTAAHASAAGSSEPGSIFETAWEILRHSPDGSHTREVTITTPQHSELPLSVSSNVIRDPHAKVVGAVLAARDLSATHRLLVAVREAESRWKLLALVNDVLASSLDTSAVLRGVCGELERALDMEAQVLVVDEGTVTRYGASLTGSEPAPSPPPYATASPSDATASPSRDATVDALVVLPRTALYAVINEGRTIDVAQIEGYPVGFDLRHGSALLAPLHAGAEVVGALVLHRDIVGAFPDQTAELAQEVANRVGLAIANARLRRSLTQAEARHTATEFRRHIAAALSHDMKTPLASILGSIQALRYGSMAPKRAEQMYELLHRQARRLDRLVGQLLDFARLEAGHPLTMTSEPTNVADVIASVISNHPGRHYEVTVGADLPTLWCDHERLTQILANLVSNATKYASAVFPIVISAVLSDDAQHVKFAVRDHGPGIEPADQARLFEQFRRGGVAGATDGAGLGLYLTKAIVDAHGGTIRCDTRVGHGTTFTVSIPVNRPIVSGMALLTTDARAWLNE